MTDEQRKIIEESFILFDSTREKLKNYDNEAIALAFEVQNNINYKFNEYAIMLKNVIKLLADEKKLFTVQIQSDYGCYIKYFKAYYWTFIKHSNLFNNKGIFYFIEEDGGWIKIPGERVLEIYINDVLIIDNSCNDGDMINCYKETDEGLL